MTKTAFDKISAGLREAIAVARGEKEPAKMTTFERVAPAGGGHESDPKASSCAAEGEA